MNHSKFGLLLAFLLLCTCLSAQDTLKFPGKYRVADAWRQLTASEEEIREDKVLNEQMLDLVEVSVTDAFLDRPTQRHRVFPGPMIQAIGLRWESVDGIRHKFIGTEKNEMTIPGKALFREYDVNMDLIPHIRYYIDLLWKAKEAQLKYPRVPKASRGSVPYIYPTEETLEKYHIHCENTPLDTMLEEINEKFYPCIRGTSMKTHENFGEAQPSIGLYGPLVLDCNHSCHPEIHPYDWIWWLDLNPNTEQPEHSRTWLIGLIRDVSRRFKHWSPSPRTGEIALPFAFPVEGTGLTLSIEHLVNNGFQPDNLKEMNIPEGAIDANFDRKVLDIEVPDLGTRTLTITSNVSSGLEGLMYWFTDLNFDEEAGLLTGRFHIGASANEIFTARIQFNHF